MIRNILLVMLTLAAAGKALAAPAPETPRSERKLAAGGIGTVEVLKLECPTMFAFDRGGMWLDLQAGPDGLVEVLRARSAVELTFTGTSGGRVALRLAPGERVSFWPVRWLEVRGSEGRLVVAAAAADWAFTVRADRLREEELAVDCDGTACPLKAGERLDLDREGAKSVFRVSGGERKGDIVAEAKPLEVSVEIPTEVPTSPGAGAEGAPRLPFVTTEWGAWEVRPAPPVSP
ncbi:MAG: hypothetical protein ACYS9X_07340 [Planctomycetota bacterium]|jgi:hypothetical protein